MNPRTKIDSRQLRHAVLFVLLLAFFSAGRAAAESSWRIGVIESLTGVAEEDGQTVVRALKLAADELNKTSQTKIELIVEDDATLPKDSVSAFQKLLSQNVDSIIGATWQHTTASITPLAARSRTVLFNTSNFPEVVNFRQGEGYVFSNAYAISDDVRTFRRFLATRKVKTIVFLRNVTNWSQVQVSIYKEIAVRENIKVLDDLESDQLENNDWRVLLPRIKAGAPDALAFFLGKNDVETLLRRAREIELKAAIFGASHTYDAFKNSKDKRVYESVCLTYPLEQLQTHKQFTAVYRERYGEPPQLYADSSYDALFILHQALTIAHQKKSSLKEALQTNAFKGLFGTYKYDPEKSLSRGNTSLVCVKDGELQIEPQP